jgi:hypothetical protein
MRTFAGGCRAESNPTTLERTIEPVPWGVQFMLKNLHDPFALPASVLEWGDVSQ